MADKHYTCDMTTADVAMQLKSMLILNIHVDDDDGYDDAEVLELVEAFNDRLDEGRDIDIIVTLNVYAVPHWNGDACVLTEPHMDVIMGCVDQWLEKQ